MNLDVTICAIGVLRVQVMLRAGRLYCADIVGGAVACQTKLRYPAGRQQPRIGRAVRRMTRAASFRLHRGMFESEWPLLVRMTLHASCICTNCQASLFQFETAMRIMAIPAAHGAFQNFVVKRLIKLVPYFGVATEAKLRVTGF